MSLLDDARRLAKSGFTPWEDSCHLTCELCGADGAGEDGPFPHVLGCPWLSLPRIVAALEKQAEKEADSCPVCWRMAHSGLGTYPFTCANGHTLYFGAGTLSKRNRMSPEERKAAALNSEVVPSSEVKTTA